MSEQPSLPAFLHSAPAPLQREFHDAVQAVRLPAGKEALHPGQPCAGMTFLTQGAVRVYLLGLEGREITLYRLGPGQACVLTAACILGHACFPASARVEQAVLGRFVPASTFRAWVNQHAFWREFVFQLLGDRLATVLARFEESTFQPLETRLARHLLDQLPPGQMRLQTTQQAIANDLGSAREVVSRLLSRWEAAGWVRRQRGAVEVLRADEIERLGRRG